MLKLVISPRARRDLKGIWKHTKKKWGAAQADKYLEDIDREIAQLLTFPEMGVSYEQIRAGYRALHAKHHRVFYLQKARAIEIIRVLHEVMDAKSHLKGEADE
jgi:toxin ParE1/3/4